MSGGAASRQFISAKGFACGRRDSPFPLRRCGICHIGRVWAETARFPSERLEKPMDASGGAITPSHSQRARARRQIDQLHAILERQIDQGRIRPGERLATERELALQFGASRSVVRAALAELHRVGKIIRKVGHGTVVTASSDTSRGSITLPLLDTSPAELLEFRLAFEPGLAEAMTLNG